MAYKGKEERGEPGEEADKVQLWTFETRESLDRFAATLDARGMVYEVRTRGMEIAQGADGLVIAVAEADYAAARRLLLRHRKRRSSADRR
jgi:hypothetical protein